jgi:hypothetical protein
MMAARKLNDTIAKMAVIEAVSSIGSSFPIEEVPATGRVIVRGLSVIANPCLLHRTKLLMQARRCEKRARWDLVHSTEASVLRCETVATSVGTGGK